MLTAALLAAGAVLLGFLGLIVVVVAVIFPSTSSSCETAGGGGGGVAVSTVNVPPGLSGLARKLWDTPLRMQPGQWYPVGATEYYAGDRSEEHTSELQSPCN